MAASAGAVEAVVGSTVVEQEDIPQDLEVALRAEAAAAVLRLLLLLGTGVEREVEPRRVRRRWFRKLPKHVPIGSRGFGRRWDYWSALCAPFRLRQRPYEVLA